MPPAKGWRAAAIVCVAGAAMAVGLLLAPRPPDGDSVDAGFARDMRTHHAQAVVMSEIVRDRSADPGLRYLTNDIIVGQQTQIGEMTGWLEAWGLSREGPPPMAWMGHPSGAMPGMAPEGEVSRLAQLPPDEMDRLFLQLMIRHHQGGLVMAEAALASARRSEVLGLASNIVATQREEIVAMGDLLRSKGGQPFADVAPLSHDLGSHHEPADLRQALLLLAVTAGAFAAAWLIAQSMAGPPAGHPGTWQAVAVAGLSASAAIHAVLAPAHFDEGHSHGVFFVTAALATAVTAGLLLAAPSRWAAQGGVALPAVLIVAYVLFRAVAPPGAGHAEPVDALGLLTQVMQGAALAACWRGRSTVRSARPSEFNPAAPTTSEEPERSRQAVPLPRSPARRARRRGQRAVPAPRA